VQEEAAKPGTSERLQGEVERVLRTVRRGRGGGELPGLQVAPVLPIVHPPGSIFVVSRPRYKEQWLRGVRRRFTPFYYLSSSSGCPRF
jgi:hypothetical protein